ncbi:ABC transporter ATP-binding protein [Actinoplanes italicus]|uniref:Putative ABC transport system ATP-binding protein n=1 Tax=Actinoplanes italicus TaxID=113567 RepID=A0A2T0JZI4_9ACTN|nr:ABC transporter ATP-binding protein [Actinoplanes italicus]PRX15877.1 putative ABC transport system ATP-binding protein [Actinoplanes italicus]GIE28675.1 ABC transporter ATP-binding protein [Actinoplanes italicus]
MLVKCDDLQHSYGSGHTAVRVFHEVSLAVDRGETLAVTGPSGSGKSTLLRIISGVQEPNSGSVFINGQKMTARNAVELRSKHIGIVYQDHRLVPFLTVRENLVLPAQLLKMSQVGDAEIDGLLSRFKLSELRDRPCESLSGGEQQRVGIARALVGGPDVLLADEPTGALDQTASRQVATLLDRLASRFGVAVIVATHDPVVAAGMHRRLAFHDGTLRDETG